MIQSVNPATGEVIGNYEEMNDSEITGILSRIHKNFLSWRKVPVEKKAELLLSTAAVLRNRREEIARMMTLEMGKLFVQSKAEVDKCAWVCEHYAENAGKYINDEIEIIRISLLFDNLYFTRFKLKGTEYLEFDKNKRKSIIINSNKIVEINKKLK